MLRATSVDFDGSHCRRFPGDLKEYRNRDSPHFSMTLVKGNTGNGFGKQGVRHCSLCIKGSNPANEKAKEK
ncbi:hypothetical protein GOBAR_AA30009 [Gossypium barbadense]|uniref:Uncharacterized protein n=1 Tax=Gossypium barbadense TaxID=3634 RepID=A0A2P5WHV5_GOSBA|nr:hypothetical protein GOBAR_AA30009 [Gossypium barbadense]